MIVIIVMIIITNTTTIIIMIIMIAGLRREGITSNLVHYCKTFEMTNQICGLVWLRALTCCS